VRFALRNDHESPVEVIVEQTGVRRSLPPGLEFVVDWTWSGFAGLTFGADWIALSVPPGGTIEVADPVPADVELWRSVPVLGECEVGEFLVHNATDAPLTTFWEPWCGGGDIAPQGDPMRVNWIGNTKGVGICYEPGLVVFDDVGASFQAWLPDGEEVFTGRTLVAPLQCADQQDDQPGARGA